MIARIGNINYMRKNLSHNPMAQNYLNQQSHKLKQRVNASKAIQALAGKKMMVSLSEITRTLFDTYMGAGHSGSIKDLKCSIPSSKTCWNDWL